jgi:hypothetical protein
MAGLPRPLDYPRTDLLLSLPGQQNGPTTRYVQRRQACIHIVWAAPRSLATTSGISDLISFPRGTEMFQFPPLATPSLCIQPGVAWTLLHAGFPIRKSAGQRVYTPHRRLSQFYHVLHRLLVPRHPPNALTSLTTENVCSLRRVPSGFHRQNLCFESLRQLAKPSINRRIVSVMQGMHDVSHQRRLLLSL